jgi:hypothetical protein
MDRGGKQDWALPAPVWWLPMRPPNRPLLPSGMHWPLGKARVEDFLGRGSRRSSGIRRPSLWKWYRWRRQGGFDELAVAGSTWRFSVARPATWGSPRLRPEHGGGGLLLLRRRQSVGWVWRIPWSHIYFLLQVGEVQLPVKTELRLGHGGRCRRLGVITLLKESQSQPFVYSVVMLWGKPRSRYLDWSIPPLYLLRALFWSRLMDDGGKRWSGVHLPCQ